MKINTKTRIKNYLITYLQNNSIERLSVKELCSDIGINRSTFYLYYSDIYQTIDEIENDVLNELKTTIEKLLGKDYYTIVKELINKVKNKKEIYLILLGQLSYHFSNKLRLMFEPFISNTLYSVKSDPKTVEYICTFILNGTMGTVNDWLINNCEPKEDQIILSFLSFFNFKR